MPASEVQDAETPQQMAQWSRRRAFTLIPLWFASQVLLGWLYFQGVGPSWLEPVFRALGTLIFWSPVMLWAARRVAARRERA
jgi:hypothetical protein